MKKYITKTNFEKGNDKKNLFIVIHYTANNGDTAIGNAQYFYSVYRGASAHYFVDEKEIVQVVEDQDIAWHIGAKSYKHKICRNYNAIGIEMCSKKYANGAYYIPEKTIQNTQALVNQLIKKYDISKENILRHYDVTGKQCPKPFVLNATEWVNFLEKIGDETMTLAQGVQIVQQKANLSHKTIDFLLAYKYGEELMIKLAEAMGE